jgi:multidrug efflux pump subunit AcrA (membrane-fusion protein)
LRLGYIVPYVVAIATIKLSRSVSEKPGNAWSSRCFVQKFPSTHFFDSAPIQEFRMNQVPLQARRRLWVAGTTLTAVAAALATVFMLQSGPAKATPSPAAQATPVSVATVVQSDVATWNEFSGRLEAVERVDIRSRVAGTVQAVHFREGALVKAGDLLLTIDPAPYQADVDRADAQVFAAQARLANAKSDYERSKRLLEEHAISQREYDERLNAQSEADANLRAAKAAAADRALSLGYTQVKAPVSGPRRQARDHHGQPRGRRPGRAGADDAGVGEPDLRELRRRRAGRHARAARESLQILHRPADLRRRAVAADLPRRPDRAARAADLRISGSRAAVGRRARATIPAPTRR